MRLSEIDCDVLLAKGEPRPLFIVIRPQHTITPEVAEQIRNQWEKFVASYPDANIPPCVLLPKQLDLEAVYAPERKPQPTLTDAEREAIDAAAHAAAQLYAGQEGVALAATLRGLLDRLHKTWRSVQGIAQ